MKTGQLSILEDHDASSGDYRIIIEADRPTPVLFWLASILCVVHRFWWLFAVIAIGAFLVARSVPEVSAP